MPIGRLLTHAYTQAVDTIMLCFCDDCQRHGAPLYAPKELQEKVLGRRLDVKAAVTAGIMNTNNRVAAYLQT